MNFPKIEKNFSYFRIWGKIGPKNDTGNQKIPAWSISIFVQICIFCALSSNSNLMRGQAWALSQIDKKNKFWHYFCHFRPTHSVCDLMSYVFYLPILKKYCTFNDIVQNARSSIAICPN